MLLGDSMKKMIMVILVLALATTSALAHNTDPVHSLQADKTADPVHTLQKDLTGNPVISDNGGGSSSSCTHEWGTLNGQPTVINKVCPDEDKGFWALHSFLRS